MAINVLEYAALFQSQLDLHIVHGTKTGWMESNAGDVIYNGGKEIKIPEVSMQGLGDYDRDEGHPRGSVSMKYRTYEMGQDRARKFRLDENDVDETNFVTAAATVMKQFQDTHVIPEVDAYRLSKLANLAGVKDVATITTANVLNKIYEQMYALADKGVDLENLIISISYPIYALLNNNDKISKHIIATDFKQGEVESCVKTLDGAVLIPVPSKRMKTSYMFRDGLTDGQKEGGFIETADAASINWIISPRSAPIAVNKTDRVKIISPEQNQTADAWDLNYHKYHELFLPYQRREFVAVSTNTAFTQVDDEKTAATTGETEQP